MNRNSKLEYQGKYAYIYCRISSETQADGTSIEEQLAKCRKFATKLGFKIEREVIEQAGAMKQARRRKFLELIDEMDKQEHAYLICNDESRLSRNGGDLSTIRERIDERRLTLFFARSEQILTYPLTPDQSLFFGMKCEIANFEIRVANQKCRDGIRNKSVAGFRPSPTPFGYTNEKKNNIAIVVEKEAKMVQRAFALASTGKNTYSEISDILYEEGYKYHHPSGKVPVSTLEHWLHNIFYTGYYNVKQLDKVYKGNHTGIISKSLFDKVQNIFGNGGKDREKHKSPYSKLILCNSCGSFLVMDVKKKKNNVYAYQRCMSKDCPSHPHVSVTEIDRKIHACWKEIRLSLIPQSIVDEVIDEQLAEQRKALASLKHKASVFYGKFAKMNAKIEENGLFEDENVKNLQNSFLEKYEEYLRFSKEKEEKIDRYISLSKKAMQSRLYDFYVISDMETQRKILELVGNKYYFKENSLKISLHPAFRVLRSRNKVQAS